MALSADRYLDQSQDGSRLNGPAEGPDTFYKGGACIFNSSGRVILKAGASGTFAGFVEKNTVVTAQNQAVPLRRPKSVWLPDSSVALANRGQICDLVTDDEALAYRARGAALTSDGTPLGLVIDVVSGESVLVEIGTYVGVD